MHPHNDQNSRINGRRQCAFTGFDVEPTENAVREASSQDCNSAFRSEFDFDIMHRHNNRQIW